MSIKLTLVLSIALLGLRAVPSTEALENFSLDQAKIHIDDASDLHPEIYSAPAETLSFIIQAGDVLIFNLPATVSGREIDSYRIRKAPALSWLVERSFFWRTLAKDTGRHEILLSGVRNGLAVEQLVIQVDIR